MNKSKKLGMGAVVGIGLGIGVGLALYDVIGGVLGFVVCVLSAGLVAYLTAAAFQRRGKS